ncbi:hypothetical protein K8089_14160 [Aequorivita sp. F47161]|uniref:Uncharacterized protein n=1 Tax=Aequorivita vitellina TaxID=2874475 RepID=A0A9X1U2S1_9FLAO|nr:hypothetical protein [Aequorivita vitellina]MCG2420170.1 hypothetical protein [Aequorivita vitellina]
MNAKNFIAFFLAGLFLMNITLSQSGELLQVLTGKEVTVVHPFCKKAKSTSNKTTSFKVDNLAANSFEISAICTTIFDFKTTSFTFVAAEDNFKAYAFAEPLHINLFAERFYIPPRV